MSDTLERRLWERLVLNEGSSYAESIGGHVALTKAQERYELMVGEARKVNRAWRDERELREAAEAQLAEREVA